MALLDRLRPQPGWKHSDPAIRLAAVEALAETEQALLATLAREDDAPRVRRAALARVDDPEVLGTIARGDADDQVKADAVSRLTTIAITLAAARGDLALGRRAVAALADERPLSTVARSAAAAELCNAALDRLTETKALGGVARHAEHEDVRLRALSRLNDRGEIEAVATRTEHKDVGLAALERLDADAAVLEAIAVRAKNKVVARRAKAIQKERAATEAEARTVAEALAKRRGQLTEAVEALEKSRDRVRAGSELARLEDEWRALGAAATEEETRWLRGTERVRMHCDDLARQETLEAERRAAISEAVSRRRTLIEAARADGNQEDGPTPQERVAALRAEWAALPPFEAEELAGLDREFTQACAAIESRVALQARAAAAQARLAELAADAAQVAEIESLDTARPRWNAVAHEWRDLTAGGVPVDAALHTQFTAAATRWKEREGAIREAAERGASENQKKLQDVYDRVHALTIRPDTPIKDIDRGVRELKAAIDNPGQLGANGEDLLGKLRGTLNALTPRLREARETDEWRRWANAGIQEELVKRMEGLGEIKDLGEVSRQVRDLRRQWKAVSVAPKDDADTLWQRFKTAGDEAQARVDVHQSAVASEQAANLARKLALVEKAETLAQSTDWIATADTLKALQAEWQTIGPIPKDGGARMSKEAAKAAAAAAAASLAAGHAPAAGEATAVDTAAGDADVVDDSVILAQDTQDGSDTAAVAEAMGAEAADVVAAPVAKDAGYKDPSLKEYAPKDLSSDVNKRFRAACDTFFTRRKTDLVQRKSEWSQNQQQKETLCERMEVLAESTDWAATFNEIKKLQADWKTVGPVRRNKSEALWKRFRGACDRFFERYGKRHEIDTRQRLFEREEICRTLEALTPAAIAAAAEAPATSATATATAVDAAPDVEAQADVATTAGTETMGADAGDTSSDDVAATAEAAEGEAESVDAVSPAIEGDASEAIQAADAADATDAVDAAGVDADVADAAAGESDLSAVAALAETPAAEVAPAAAAAPAVPVEPPTREELVRAVEEAWRRWRSAPGLPNESMVPVRARFESALTSVLTSYASAFQGTPFDLTNTLKRMKTLCDDVEGVARGGASEAQLGATSVTALATLLKEKLAANTIGGRVNEEAKTRAAADRVRRAQMAWRDLGPVFGTEGHQLEARFHRAVRRFFEQNPGFEQTQHRDQRGGGGDHRGGGGGGGRDQRGDHRGDNRGGQRDQRGGHGARPHGGGGGRPGDQQARTRGAS